MAENPNQKQIDKLKKQFAKNNNENKGSGPNGPKKPAFRLYWVYAIVIALFIGMNIFSAMTFTAKDWQRFI